MTVSDTKVVLVTGCSSGIGRELVRQLREQGHGVAATARRPDTLRDLLETGVTTHRLDVTDEDSIHGAVAEVMEAHGRIDILINNAGSGLIGPTAELPMADIRRQFETNVFGALALIQAVVPVMARQGSGRIINMGSVSGITATPWAGPYCASKAALHLFSDALRMELAPFGISVITVQPGGIRSQFFRQRRPGFETTGGNLSPVPRRRGGYGSPGPDEPGQPHFHQGFRLGYAAGDAAPRRPGGVPRRSRSHPDAGAEALAAHRHPGQHHGQTLRPENPDEPPEKIGSSPDCVKQ